MVRRVRPQARSGSLAPASHPLASRGLAPGLPGRRGARESHERGQDRPPRARPAPDRGQAGSRDQRRLTRHRADSRGQRRDRAPQTGCNTGGAKMSVVSVILPTYNRRETIMAAIASVQRQTFHDWEMIVVDDGSTDDTVSLIEGSDPRLVLIRQKN